MLRWGRPCATLIFERGNLRDTLLEVADDFGIAFSVPALGNVAPALGNVVPALGNSKF